MILTQRQTQYLKNQFNALFDTQGEYKPDADINRDFPRLFNDFGDLHDPEIKLLLYRSHENLSTDEAFEKWAFQYLQACIKSFYENSEQMLPPSCIQKCLPFDLSKKNTVKQEEITAKIFSAYTLSINEALNGVIAQERNVDYRKKLETLRMYVMEHIHKQGEYANNKESFKRWVNGNKNQFQAFQQSYRKWLAWLQSNDDKAEGYSIGINTVAKKSPDDPSCLVSIIKDEAIRLSKINRGLAEKVDRHLMEAMEENSLNEVREKLTSVRKLLITMLPNLWRIDKETYFNVFEFAANQWLDLGADKKIRIATPYELIPEKWRRVVNSEDWDYENWNLIKQQDEMIAEHLRLAYTNANNEEKKRLQDIGFELEIMVNPNIYKEWLESIKSIVDNYVFTFLQSGQNVHLERERLLSEQEKDDYHEVFLVQDLVEAALNSSGETVSETVFWKIFTLMEKIKTDPIKEGSCLYKNIMNIFSPKAINYLFRDSRYFHQAVKRLALITEAIPKEKHQSTIIGEYVSAVNGLLSEITETDFSKMDVLLFRKLVDFVKVIAKTLLECLSRDDFQESDKEKNIAEVKTIIEQATRFGEFFECQTEIETETETETEMQPSPTMSTEEDQQCQFNQNGHVSLLVKSQQRDFYGNGMVDSNKLPHGHGQNNGVVGGSSREHQNGVRH